MKARIAVLISGRGSNLQALIDAIDKGHCEAQIVCVVSNKPEAYGLMRAKEANIPAMSLPLESGESREDYDQRLAMILESFKPDWIVLAGFMRILSPEFVQRFTGKIMNIHPSLLPKYPGLHTHKQVLKHQDKEHGCSIHFVDQTLDGGPLIAQSRIPVKKSDTPESLQKKVQVLEHKLYPLVIQWLVQGRVVLHQNKVALNELILPAQGAQVRF